jgi:uncharacterized membrane protein YhhN
MSAQALSIVQARGFSAIERALLWLSAGCSLGYFITKSWQPYSGSIVLKALCIAPLALIALRLLNPLDNWLLGSALLFSTLGDIFLDLNGFFVHGLGAFLIAHLIYLMLFVRNGQRPLRLTSNQVTSLIALLLYSFALTTWLWPGLGKLAVPVLLYVCAITLMVASAIAARFRQSWIVWGALLFLISDSLIGISKFKTPVPLRDYLVWAIYYLGQCGIALGFLREKLEQD